MVVTIRENTGNIKVVLPVNLACVLSPEELRVVFDSLNAELLKIAELNDDIRDAISVNNDREFYSDPGDSAWIEDRAARLKVNSQNARRVHLILSAINQILKGNYTGRCLYPVNDKPTDYCNEPIGFRRLSVIPESQYCADCQKKMERNR
jgi:RNA polymerase-binding transcription factor DksA